MFEHIVCIDMMQILLGLVIGLSIALFIIGITMFVDWWRFR